MTPDSWNDAVTAIPVSSITIAVWMSDRSASNSHWYTSPVSPNITSNLRFALQEKSEDHRP